ncbi:MAG: glucose-6-phosphate dehydrogenase [Thermoguttaceae bacterium]|jgi:glucose-6-phosphate 1-dehydrogenase
MTTATVIHEEAIPGPAESLFIQEVQKPEPFTMVIFGATGDLTSRKLLPALYGLWQARFLPESFAIVGIGRRDKNNDIFREETRTAIAKSRQDSPAATDGWNGFLGHIFYQRADFSTAEGMKGICGELKTLEREQNLPGNRLVYLATDPEYFGPIIEGAVRAGIVNEEMKSPWGRVVIEKPFGQDLKSALELDRRILSFLRPDQIYRIDHYLGKETVQNLLAFRFGNAIFEPLLNRQQVDHVQITVAETIGMEGRRGAYYDHAGASRDVAQNHLLQLLALVAMEPPASLKARDIQDAKLKLLRNIVARKVVRGQYGAGTLAGETVRAYRDEDAVARDSNTETFIAMRVELENWRWGGTPFLLRTGKRLARHVTEIAIQFKLPPLRLFRTVECVGDFCDLTDMQPNVLVFRIQPDEGISLSFSAMRPGMNVYLHPVRFEFDYGKTFGKSLPDAYERLLLDALRGDPTLFIRSDVLEASWEFITPILEAWKGAPPHFPNYAPGSWGPAEADSLTQGCEGGWRRP